MNQTIYTVIIQIIKKAALLYWYSLVLNKADNLVIDIADLKKKFYRIL